VTAYAEAIVDGTRPAGKWIYAAAKRFLADLERTDIYMDWDEVDRLLVFMGH
jgi:phage terminase large subunit-like protein